MFKDLEEGKRTFYSDNYFSGPYNHEVFLKRANDDGSNKPKFYISVFTRINNELVLQGYIYFYIDFINKKSNFIGISVNKEYRNNKIGSFLIASWINLCMDNGYSFLSVNEKQRKPFILYLLKKYGFEIFDTSLYDTRNDVVYICKSDDTQKKLLLFKNLKNEMDFRNSNIYKNDDYLIIHDTSCVSVLDKVILPIQNRKKNSVTYELSDCGMAINKTKKIIMNHKR